ncbi:MAG: protein-L-isoaspartate(D-aspartate) O-methyltransferase [Clostridiales bacterium]|nr:protein-L-isoaspartate(D-aspartate) O-methyltransferase [Clostridiales bacterium]
MDEQELERFYKSLDRRIFLNSENRDHAKIDGPLPIGFGQTISQPSLVFEMTRLLAPEKDSRVLEIGTGSGYQTALLAEFSGKVYTVERIPELAALAQKRLDLLGFSNIEYKTGDGSDGWKENAPYDRIMVTAAAGRLPEELLNQLAEGGSMIVPVGPAWTQELLLVKKARDGGVTANSIEKVVFVEFKGKYGW